MKHILAPTDFSENSSNAVEYAAVIAQACGASITLLNVYTPAVSRYSVISPLIAEEVSETRIELHRKLQLTADTLSKLHPGLKCEVAISIGEMVDEVLHFEKHAKPDMIIMGTQGASSLEKVLLGSNAAEIIEKARCPVLVIPAKATSRIPKKILFATDYAYNDIEGANFLTSLAQLFGSMITFIHVTTSEDNLEAEQDLIEKFAEEIKAATHYSNINSRIFSDNTVIMGLDSILQNSGADIIALSTRKRNILEKLYNPSMTKKLAQYTTVPLLAFKADQGR